MKVNEIMDLSHYRNTDTKKCCQKTLRILLYYVYIKMYLFKLYATKITKALMP